MSYSVDVNLLLYASDESSQFHRKASDFLKECGAGRDLFCLAYITLMSYLRIATHPRIFKNPLSPAEAMENLRMLTSLPQVRLISEDEGFLEIYRDMFGRFPVRGNLVPDAHLAALLQQHGVGTLYTNDPDFKKFDSIRVENPFS